MSREKFVSFFCGFFSMLILILGMIVFAWTPPSQNPPQEMVPAPLNVSTQAQAKEGALIVANNSVIPSAGFIVAFGNVGIGTINPQAKLDIFSSTTDNILRLSRKNAAYPLIFKLGADSTFQIVNTNTTLGISPDCEQLTTQQECSHFSSCCTWAGYECFLRGGRTCSNCPDAPGCLITQEINLLTITNNGKIGIATNNPQRAKMVIEDTVVSPIDSPWTPGSANNHAFGLMVYDPSPVATDKTLYNVEGTVKEMGVSGSGTGHRVGVHGTVVNNAENDWILAGSLAQMSGPINRAYGVQGYIKSCPSGYSCFSGYFGSSNGTFPFVVASGNVGIGTMAPGYKLTVNGSAYATAYNCASDINKKENLEKLNNILEKISNINAYYFNWKDDSDKKRQIGLVAQEVENYFPELVSTNVNEEGKEEKALDYSRMAAVLLEAIKEQQKEIERLKVEISKMSK